MTMPTKVKLSKDEATKLRKLNDKTTAVNKFCDTIMRQGEARLAELQAEGRTIWTAIAAAHDLDLARVNYDLSDDGDELVPLAIKL